MRVASSPMGRAITHCLTVLRPTSTRYSKGSGQLIFPSSDLPNFELVINLKAAKAIGLEVPPTLLARADDEMLTVNRLGLPAKLRRSLACTNSIENMMGTGPR